MRTLLPWLACACLCSCMASPKLRERTEPANGAILMTLAIRGRQFPYWLSHQADQIFFARVGPGGQLDSVLLASNYRVGDRVYLLDIPPGRYAVSAASYYTGRNRQLARLDEMTTREWQVDVKPGALVFAGVSQLSRFFAGWDVFVWNGLRRAAAYLPPFKRATIPMQSGQPRIDRSPATEGEALRLARGDMPGTYWVESIDQRLRQLGPPPPPAVEGFILKSPAKRLDSGSRFSYIDTLRWGAPVPVSGGLEWREPRGRAWVSVTFSPADGPGAAPLPEVLAQLRQAGAPEDNHLLAEIQFSTRPAYGIRYTTYLYPDAALLGSAVRVLKTETVVVPARGGHYKIQYRAPAEEFSKRLSDFRGFAAYLNLAEPPPAESRSLSAPQGQPL